MIDVRPRLKPFAALNDWRVSYPKGIRGNIISARLSGRRQKMEWPRGAIAALSFTTIFLITGGPAVAAEELRLTMQGLGPVAIGMTIPQAEKALGKKFRMLDKSDGISTDACWLTQIADGTQSWATYMVQQGQIVRIDVWEAPNTGVPVATEKRIRIGSPQQSVFDAYPNAEAAPHPHMDLKGRYIRVLTDDKIHGLLFETTSGKVVNFRVGKRDAIELTETCL